MGRRGPLLTPFVIAPEAPWHTLRDLLADIVRQQVAAFRERKSEVAWLRVLTQADLEAGQETGRIVSGELLPDPRVPDAEEAVAVALRAFADGLYFVFVNDVQVEDLDQPIGEVRTVLFVRLTPLAGG